MILIALGANLPSSAGPPEATLRAALSQLTAQGARVSAVSRFFANPAWPDPSDPSFVNAAAIVETALTPAEMMALLTAVEAQFGRTRSARNAPRTLDLDLIDYDGAVSAGALDLPHPRAAERAFVMIPIADIAPGWLHPVSGACVADMIAALPEAARQQVRPFYL